MSKSAKSAKSINGNMAVPPIVPDGIVTRRRSLLLQAFNASDPSPFDDLPNEVLLNICSFLDREALKKTLLVDRRFNEVITQSSSTMLRLPLTVGTVDGPENHAIQSFNRKYKEVVFKDIARNKWLKYVKKSLDSIGKSVTKVSIKDCQLPPEGIANVLSSFPKIVHLKVASTKEYKTMESRIDPPLDPEKFPMLKEIQLDMVNTVLKTLVNLQLKFIQILRIEGEEWKHLSDLISKQRSLQTLTILDSRNIPIDMEIQALRPELNIQYLSFIFLRNFQVQKFIDFLLSFVDRIKFLTLIRVQRIDGSNRIFESVLQNFKGLSGLAVDFDHFSSNELFYRSIDVNRKLKSLALNSGYLNNSLGFRGIFRVYPAVSRLSISINNVGIEMKAEDFDFMYATLKNLQAFFLVLTSSLDLNRGFFKNITSLNIVNLHYEIDWDEIGRTSPNLTEVTITNKCRFCAFSLNAMVSGLSRLEYLEIGEGFRINKAEMRILKKAENLKTLKILKSSWHCKGTSQQVLESLKMNNLEIVFKSSKYDNVSYFNNTLFFKSI